MKRHYYVKELFGVCKNYLDKLQHEKEIELKNAQAGYSKFTGVEKHNRKLRNKYCMAGRIW